MKTIKVILLENVRRLGVLGDTVSVAPGFFRNFLFPKGIAVPANQENRAYFEERRSELEEKALKLITEAEQKAALIEGKNVIISVRAAEEGKLYGSVSAADIAEALNAALEGVVVLRHEISLSQAIREVGVYSLLVQLHADVSANISVQIQAE
jgi:large subunit ribosomal protein L9